MAELGHVIDQIRADIVTRVEIRVAVVRLEVEVVGGAIVASERELVPSVAQRVESCALSPCQDVARTESCMELNCELAALDISVIPEKFGNCEANGFGLGFGVVTLGAGWFMLRVTISLRPWLPTYPA